MVSSKSDKFLTSILAIPNDVTGKEKKFFTQIINQSAKYKPKTSGAGTALQAAKKLLKDSHFITETCKALRGFLTHNPKIFDAKVKARVFLPESNFVKDTPYIYSDSLKYHHQYDWAGNAKYMPKRYFLCTEFIHNGRQTTLYHEFIKESSDLIGILIGMGLTKAHHELIKSSCQIHRDHAFPDSVPPYQVQVLIPYTYENGNTDYISLSPVSASKVQAAIHTSCLSDNGRLIGRAFHNPTRPENIGAFAVSTGGSIGVLAPDINLRSEVALTTSQIIKELRNKNDLFDTSDLDFSDFLKLRKRADFASNWYIPSPKSPEKAAFLDLIHKNIARMFAKLDQLRFTYQIGDLQKENIKGLNATQVSYVVEAKLSEQAMQHIWKQANAVIQKYISGTRYKQLTYHPTLTRYISESVRNHLKPLFRGSIELAKPEIVTGESPVSKNNEEASFHASTVYMLIPKLTVMHAHADNSPYTTGLPAITALVGFADRLCRNIKSQFQFEISNIKVAWLIHSFQRVKGIKKHEPARWNGKTKTALSDVVSLKFCNLTFDLVLECSSDYEQLTSVRHLLAECLPVKFASGMVSTAEEGFASDYLAESFQIYQSTQELLYGLQVEGTPRWMVLDYSSKFTRKSDDILEDLVDAFSAYKDLAPDRRQLTFSGIGYKLLEEPVQRLGSRLEYHAYCEPIVGVQELRLITEISFEEFHLLPLFWSYKSAGKTILCQAE